MKNTLAITSRSFHKNQLVLPRNMIFHYNTFQIERNKGLFLDVNQKRPFLGLQKITKATKLKKCPTKQISWVIWLYEY